MCTPHDPQHESPRDPVNDLSCGVVGVLARVEAAVAELASWDADHADAGRGDAVGVRGEVVLRVLAAQRALGAVAAGLAGSFCDSGEWASDGAPSAKAWIAGRINDDPAQARSLIGHAQVLGDFPALATAWREGRVSGRHVGVLRGILTKYHALREDLIAVDEQVTAIATACDPRQFDTQLRALCHRADPDTAEGIDQARRRLTRLHASPTLDGYVRVDGLLDPALGQHLLDTLESARRAVAPPEGNADGTGSPRDTRPISERNLDALARILNAATAHTGDLALPALNGARPVIHVTVPLHTLLSHPGQKGVHAGWLDRYATPATLLTATTVQHLACDATLRPLLVDKHGQLIAMLPATRTIHPALRRAVHMRDRHCRFPHCTQRIDEIHHIVYHSRGGPTTLDNLTGLCRYHHHQTHDHHWHITGNPNHALHFRSPHHATWTTHPPGQQAETDTLPF